MLHRDLQETLARIGTLLAGMQDPWWIIGSAAVVLHGAVDAVADIDVLLSIADARRILPILGLAPAPGTEDALFRSSLFATWTDAATPVEFMAGFAIRTPTGWRDIRPATRECIYVADVGVFVPGRAELYDLLLSFGRAKDLARAGLLAALD